MSDTYEEKTAMQLPQSQQFFPDMRKNRFSERLKWTMQGATNSSFAKKIGITEATVRNYLSDKTSPTLSVLENISRATNTPLTWLVSGEGTTNETGGIPVATPTRLRAHADDDFVTVNDFSNVEAAAGGGAYITNEETTGRMAFRREWVAREGLKAQALRVIRARGDSMEPTIQDGAPILLEVFAYEDENGNLRYLYSSNSPREVVKRDGVYVVRLDDKLLVKRLQLDMLGGLLVKSDNQTYDTLHIPASQIDEIAVIGRVVWTGRKL